MKISPLTRMILAIMGLLTCAGTSHAEIQVVTATHTYVMGDNDSRNDARQLCFLEAKRKVIEKSGVYIESQSEVKDFQLTKNQINSYSAAVLSVEIIKEDFAYKNGQNILTLSVKADVDIADVKKRIAAIVTDKNLQDRIASQQEQIRRLKERAQQLNSQLNTAPESTAGGLRKERNVIFGDIMDLENKKLAAVEAISAKTEIVKRYIVKNMTRAEVMGILGSPRAVSYPWITGNSNVLVMSEAHNYGELWVIFHEGLVACISGKDICY